MNKKEIAATEKLASALDKLADHMERFVDPVVWQKVLSDAMGLIPSLAQIGQPVRPGLAVTPLLGIEGVTIKLSDEEREKLANQVYEAIKPQLSEFNDFVQKSLLDMPAHRLKKIAEKIAAGGKPSLGRERGCVFIEAGDEKVYLGL
jgi:hypothetical protein